MRFKKFGNKFIVRLDKGEEIVEALEQFCEENKITVGVISGIGAVNNAVLKFFDPQTKKYFSKEFSGSYEIAPLNGNISAMNGRAYLHLHINLTDSGFNSFGGHLESAIVSATFEAIIEKISGRIGRSFDEQAGLNIFKM